MLFQGPEVAWLFAFCWQWLVWGQKVTQTRGEKKKTLSYVLKEPSVHLLKTSLVQGGEHQKKDFGIEET